MTSHTTRQFRELFAVLPSQVQQQAREAYAIFQQNPSHPGLRFKQVKPGPPPTYSARVSLGYRALAAVQGGTAVWFWIGSHADYDRLLKGLS
jgi:hypothetical protein